MVRNSEGRSSRLGIFIGKICQRNPPSTLGRRMAEHVCVTIRPDLPPPFTNVNTHLQQNDHKVTRVIEFYTNQRPIVQINRESVHAK